MLTITQVASSEQITDVHGLLREFTTWAMALDPEGPKADTFKNLEQELAALPGIFGPPSGRLLLASVEGAPAGCVGFRAIDPQTVELKRMYVRQGFRGQRIGENLVQTLLAEARLLGYRRIFLSTYYTMESAHRLYRAAGFLDYPAPDDVPEHMKARVIFMEKDLV